MKIAATKKCVGEYYASYDEDTGLYCVFHTDKGDGKAFYSFASQNEADHYAKKLND